MKEGLEKEVAKKENSLTKENRDPLTIDNGKKKSKEERPATKVVVRRLPPSMTRESFIDQVSPMPVTDYMYFVQADTSLTPHCFSRAYINFTNQEDLFIFTQKFDNYVFVDSKGQEYAALVEFAPFQRIPKHRPNRRKDLKMGTLDADPIYISFKEKLEAEMLENKLAANAVKQHFFETSAVTNEKKEVTTPLLDFIKNRRVERQRIRDEKREEKRKKDLERRRAKDEQRKTKKDDESPAVKVLHSTVANKEKLKERDTSRSSLIKKRTDETKYPKDKGSAELRSRENKNRIGKSYQEERQRQAERREELKRKTSILSRSQSSLSESKTSLSESKEETDQTKSSNSEEKSSISERRLRDSERRKTDRSYRKDEIRKSTTRSEGRRDIEETGRRRSGKANELRPFNRKEEDRKDEVAGRRRTSEIKKNSEYSNLDRNKERVKGRTTSKKNLDSAIGTEKQSDKNNKEQKCNNINDSETRMEEGNNNFGVSVIIPEKNKNNKNKLEDESKNCTEPKEKLPKRRNSLESGTRDRIHLCDSDNKSEQKTKKRRRNSFDSLSNTHSYISVGFLTKVQKERKQDVTKVVSTQESTKINPKDNKTDINKVQNFASNEAEVPKRRKSMEERRVECNKELSNSDKRKHFNRRNSLESGDQRQNSERLEKCKKNENENRESERGDQKQNKDPRTVRRIRNKDRPTLEIYRPGMGRFSKQRLEREKVLGSSTEVDSPSSSPSPTPVSKPKSTLTREH